MSFTIDTDLIENDEVKLTENSNGELEIVHIPTGNTFLIDTTENLSNLDPKSDSEIVSAVEETEILIRLDNVTFDPNVSVGTMWYRSDLD